MVEKRRDARLMGKVVGAYDGWDQLYPWAILLLGFEPNGLGKRFVPDFTGPRDLAVNFETGEASVHDGNGNETLLRTDWSVFNRAEQAPGWQAP